MGSQLILEGNTSVRDEYVKVSLILGNFYPHYEFIKLFSNLHTPPSEAPGRASLGGGGLFFSFFRLYKRSPYVSCHDHIFSFFRSLPARLLFLSRLYFISGLSRVFSPLKDLAMISFFLEPVFPYTTICLFSRYAFVQCCTSMLQQCCTSMFRCCCNIEVQH